MNVKNQIRNWLKRYKSGSIVTSALAREKGVTLHRRPFRQVCRELGCKEIPGRPIGFLIP